MYLYLKTHNDTGKKYLGMTSYNPYEYKGSGLHWLRHIKKNGNDVRTEVLFESSNAEEFQSVAREYSDRWDVQNNKDFLNLVPENGDGNNTKNQNITFREKSYRSLREIERETGISLYRISKEIGIGWANKDRTKIQRGRYLFRGKHFDFISHIMNEFGLSRKKVEKELTSHSESL